MHLGEQLDHPRHYRAIILKSTACTINESPTTGVSRTNPGDSQI